MRPPRLFRCFRLPAAAIALLPVASATAQLHPAVAYPTGQYPYRIVTADFNGDGILDLAVSNSTFTGSISIFLGKGDGTFAPQVAYASGGDEPYALAVADFNRDGHPDLAVGNFGTSATSSTTTLLLGKGDGTFAAPMQLPSIPFPLVAAAADFNHDGRPDLVVGGNSAQAEVLLGNGDGTFQPPLLLPYLTRALAVGDFNHDGRPDLALAEGGFNGVIRVLLGNGDGTFRARVSFSGGAGVSELKAVDLDGDGALDLVATDASTPSNGTGGTTVSVLLGNGDGTFRARKAYPAGAEPIGFSIADFNHDGYLDLFVSDYAATNGTTVSVLLGDGDGAFSAPVPYTVGTGPVYSAAADFNRDGAPDAAVANVSSDTMSVLLNSVVPTCTRVPVIAHLHAVPYQLSPADNRLVPVNVAYDVLSACSGTPICRIGISSNPATAPADRIVLDPHTIQLRAKQVPASAGPLTYQVNVRCIDASGNRTDAATPVAVIP